MRFVCRKFARETRDKEILALREKVFGTARGLTGERWLARPLDGKAFRRWYFPSKYSFQNFRVSEYFDMQAERFNPRPAHPAINLFQETIKRVRENQETVKALLGALTPEQFAGSGAYQDLHAVYMLISETDPLAFAGGAVKEDGPEEVAFLLEVLHAQAGPAVAKVVAEKANGLQWVEARALVLDALKSVTSAVQGVELKAVDLSDTVLNEEEKKHLARRHRFVDPLQRRRRLKWMERLIMGKHSTNELKTHGYYKTHPDNREMFPTNMGPVSIKWPSPYH